MKFKEAALLFIFLVGILYDKANASSNDEYEVTAKELDEGVLVLPDEKSAVDARNKNLNKFVFLWYLKSCVNGNNLILHKKKTVDECQNLCTKQKDCYGFEYGVDYGGAGKYKPGDCQLQSSSDMTNCNGEYHNLDFYVMRSNDICQTPELYVRTSGTIRLNCMGNCKGDGDCDFDGWKCGGSKTKGDRIAGCKGQLGIGGFDQNSQYCYNDKILRVLPTDEKGPKKQCEGNCFDNEDCGDGLVCRDYDPDSNGCTNPCEVNFYNNQFCQPPEVQLNYGNGGSVSVCEECVRDTDCPALHVCTQYYETGHWFDAVPGCSLSEVTAGEVRPWMKFCTKPFAKKVVESNQTPEQRLGLCQGNCVTDNDCAGPLVCYKREGNEEMPMCNLKEGNRRFFGFSGINVCKTPTPNVDGALKRREGDYGDHCQKSRQCKKPFRCQRRNGYTTPKYMYGNAERDTNFCTPDFEKEGYCPKRPRRARNKILKEERSVQSQRYQGDNHCCNNFWPEFRYQYNYGTTPGGGGKCECDNTIGYTYLWRITGDNRVKIGCTKHDPKFDEEWERNCFRRIKDNLQTPKEGQPIEFDYVCAKVKPTFTNIREMYKEFDGEKFDFFGAATTKVLQGCNAAEVIMQDHTYCEGKWMTNFPNLHSSVEYEDYDDGKMRTEWFRENSMSHLEEVLQKLVPGAEMDIRRGRSARVYFKGPKDYVITPNSAPDTW